MVRPEPKKRMKYAVNLYLLLIEKGKLSPGGGRPWPSLLRALVANPRAVTSVRDTKDNVTMFYSEI